MRQALIYSLKVWSTTVVFGPCAAALILVFVAPDDLVYFYWTDIITGYLYALFAGILLCIPSALLFYLATLYLQKVLEKNIYKKLFLTVAAGFLSIIPFLILNSRFIFDFSYNPQWQYWLPSYIIITITGVVFYK